MIGAGKETSSVEKPMTTVLRNTRQKVGSAMNI